MSNPWMKFYPQDWQGDEGLQMCSLSARGLWIEMLCIMHKNGGYLSVGSQPVTETLLAIKVGAKVEQVTELLCELENLGVFSRTRAGVIYSRRMLSDLKKANTARKNGKTGGNPSLGNTKENQPLDNPLVKQEVIPPKKPDTRNQNKEKPTKENYWWSLEVIKLVRKDYEAWFERFPGNDDQFTDWLKNRDEWYRGQLPHIRKNWFFATSEAIEKLNQEAA